jgi:hypothetical protein
MHRNSGGSTIVLLSRRVVVVDVGSVANWGVAAVVSWLALLKKKKAM